MPHKPTLLVLASTFPRWKNDTEPRFVYDLCQHLKNSFNIIVLAPHCQQAKTKEILDDLEVIRYRYAPKKFEQLAYEGGITAKLKQNKLNWFLLPLFFFGQWLAIIRLLRQKPVKIIHAHWLIPQAILALLARSFSKNKPAILCTSHGGDLYGLNDPLSKSIKRYVIKNIDKLTVVSTAMQKEVRRLVPNAVLPIVVPMGTDLHRLFTPDLSVARKSNQLLFVGRLVEKKGLKYLFQALPEIIEKYPDIKLNIAGTGPEQAQLEKQAKKLKIKDNINFLGRLTHQQLVAQYRTATMAVFPFIQAKNGDIEGLGLVMIEAMGCGCPVIASDIPAIRDVISDGKTGILVKTANSQHLQKNLVLLLNNVRKRQEISDNALYSVNKKFSWSVTSQNYQELLQTLADKH